MEQANKNKQKYTLFLTALRGIRHDNSTHLIMLNQASALSPKRFFRQNAPFTIKNGEVLNYCYYLRNAPPSMPKL